uniref:C-type lectin domain-containing protein n=1 Tax=Mola mola TaxID=94237 RepID=A0A3Q3XID6_MOLML
MHKSSKSGCKYHRTSGALKMFRCKGKKHYCILSAGRAPLKGCVIVFDLLERHCNLLSTAFIRSKQWVKTSSHFVQRRSTLDENFAGGHLASITSSQIHRGVMDLIQKHNGGYTSTWVGGLRYLETGRFMWLDGARWSYADWASGEPNNSSSREDCLELMADGNGQFNDLGCQVPLAYICSYPNQ